MLLLEVPAEWLFQPLFPSHQAPSWVGLCCREKTKDPMVTWECEMGGGCICHDQMPAGTQVFFSTKVKKILMVLEATFAILIYAELPCSLCPPIIKETLFSHWLEMPYMPHTTIRLSFIPPTHPASHSSFFLCNKKCRYDQPMIDLDHEGGGTLY